MTFASETIEAPLLRQMNDVGGASVGRLENNSLSVN